MPSLALVRRPVRGEAPVSISLVTCVLREEDGEHRSRDGEMGFAGFGQSASEPRALIDAASCPDIDHCERHRLNRREACAIKIITPELNEADIHYPWRRQ